MIELKHLACGYGAKQILKNINLCIENHVTILGLNGSGKSTFAKAVCGLIAYEGTITLDSSDIKTLEANTRAKSLSYIPSKLEAYDEFMNVEEFVLLGRYAHKESFFDYSPKDKKIADKCIKLLHLQHLKEHTLHSLSSGEAQLVQIASALASQSGTIILDEPTANLDPKNAKIIAHHIKALKQYHNIILITHDLHLACYVGSEIAFIKEGGVLHFKIPEDFFSDTNLQELYGVAFNALAVKYD